MTLNIELQQIIQNAYSESHLAQKALSQNRAYYAAIYSVQTELLSLIADLFNQDNKNIRLLQQSVLDRIERDLFVAHQLNEKINASLAQLEMGYPLKTNKMVEILMGTQEFLADSDHFKALIQGYLPNDLAVEPNFPVIIGDENSIFGNSKLTFFSAALIEIACTLLGPKATIQDLGFNFSLESSPIVHVIPLPSYFFKSDPLFQDLYDNHYTFHFRDSTLHHGLAYLHSGYTYGGYRDETRYPEDKLFGPEDCSSWIAKISGAHYGFTTADQLMVHRASLEGHTAHLFSKFPLGKAKELLDLYSPAIIHNPTDIHVGQIITYRDFEGTHHQKSLGIGGHTGLVLGITADEKVVTLNYKREMPTEEGFGIKLFDWQSSDTREVIFFEHHPSSIQPDDIIINSYDEWLVYAAPDSSILLAEYTTPLSLQNMINTFISTDNDNIF